MSQNNQFENMLKITAERLGTTPDALKQAAQNGTMGQILGKDSQESAALQKVLSDPEAAKKLLSSPQAKKLMDMFSKGKK